MTPTSHLFKTLRRTALCLCVALAVAAPLHAEDLPKFSEPEANEYVKKLNAATDAFLTAAKDKDEAKINELALLFKDLTAQGSALGAKIKPEEREAFGNFMMAEGKKLIDAAQATQ